MSLDKESIEHMNFRIAVHAAEAQNTAFPRCDLQEIRRVFNNPELLQDMHRMINKPVVEKIASKYKETSK